MGSHTGLAPSGAIPGEAAGRLTKPQPGTGRRLRVPPAPAAVYAAIKTVATPCGKADLEVGGGEETRMNIQHNIDRIQTTHIGSLPRPHGLLDLMKAKLNGEPYDRNLYEAMLKSSVADVVRKQAACGIDIVTDGEFSKP
ncbi:MAG: hypothetical protein J2P53_18010, partial [Bradyrhizobiaceae bacterium]|nr:hypothetical protein [Bradyrhizobiaceae bacterium]